MRHYISSAGRSLVCRKRVCQRRIKDRHHRTHQFAVYSFFNLPVLVSDNARIGRLAAGRRYRKHGNHGKRFFHTCLSREKIPYAAFVHRPGGNGLRRVYHTAPAYRQDSLQSFAAYRFYSFFHQRKTRVWLHSAKFDVLHSGPCERLFHPVYQTAFNRAAPAVM